jgi:flavin reductase (DIM6/NTAB) family NADH-FMN oxidoreductase RutF
VSIHPGGSHLIEIDTSTPIWDRFFTVAPLVLVGTTDSDGALDLAPKHMVTPMGWCLAASPRSEVGDKPILDCFSTFPAKNIEGHFIEEAYLYFECRHFKTIDGFGSNCLITGEIIAAYADREVLRADEIDDQELIHSSPLFAYLAPGRFAAIDRSNAFPFPADMKK